MRTCRLGRTSPLAYDPEVERSARLRRKAVRQFSTNLDFAVLEKLFIEMPDDDDATGEESSPRDVDSYNFKIQPNLIAILPVFRGHEDPYTHLREFLSIVDTYQVNNTTKDGELAKVFYDGLDYHNQQFVMATSEGTFFSRPMKEEWEFFKKLSNGSKTQALVDRNSNHTSSANFVSNQHGTNFEISELSKKVDPWLRNLGKGVLNVSQVSHDECPMCGDPSHLLAEKVHKREVGKLPSYPTLNPKHKPDGHEHVNMVTSLQNVFVTTDNVKSDSKLVNNLLKDFPKPPTQNPKATESPKVEEGGVSSTTTPYPAALEKSASVRLAKRVLIPRICRRLSRK
nr:hypothetical protein [Tanacetum cinerariifolium]